MLFFQVGCTLDRHFTADEIIRFAYLFWSETNGFKQIQIPIGYLFFIET